MVETPVLRRVWSRTTTLPAFKTRHPIEFEQWAGTQVQTIDAMEQYAMG